MIPRSEHADQKGVPVVRVEARVAELGGVLGEGHRMDALLGDPVHLLRHPLRIPDRRGGERDEPARMGAAPLLDVPVVVGLEQGAPEVFVIGAGEQLPGEAGDRAEAHGSEHAIGIHVLDPLVHVEAPGPHLRPRRRLEPVLVRRSAGHRVEADVHHLCAEELPDLGAIRLDHVARGLIPDLRRGPPFEQMRWLHHMVVHAHQDQVVDLHAALLPGHASEYRPTLGGRLVGEGQQYNFAMERMTLYPATVEDPGRDDEAR